MQNYLELLLDLLDSLEESGDSQTEDGQDLLARKTAVPAAGSKQPEADAAALPRLELPGFDAAALSQLELPGFDAAAGLLPEDEEFSAGRTAGTQNLPLPRRAQSAGGAPRTPDVQRENRLPGEQEPIRNPEVPEAARTPEVSGEESEVEPGEESAPLALAVQMQKTWRRNTGSSPSDAGAPSEGADSPVPAWTPQVLPEQADSSSGSTALQSQLRTAQRAAEYRPASMGGTAQSGAGLDSTLDPLASPALDLLSVDRAFERDARRYDAGFTLY